MTCTPPPKTDAAHVVLTCGGRKGVYIASRPPGRATSTVATLVPPPGEWAQDVALLVGLLSISELDALVGSLEGRVVFDATGTWGLLALVAAQHGARACHILTTRPSLHRSVLAQIEGLGAAAASVSDVAAVETADVVVVDVYRRSDLRELQQLARRMRPRARLLLFGAIESQIEVIERAMTSNDLRRAQAPRWIDEMVVLTFAKVDAATAPRRPARARPAIADEIAGRRWHALCRPLQEPNSWTIRPFAGRGPLPASTLVIAPSLVYGSGGNSLTRAMLRAIAGASDELLAHRDVLDLGCGSGVLGIAAARRRARVTAVDICPTAREAALRNAASNDVTLAVAESVPEDGDFDVVLANLQASTWAHFIAKLAGFMRPGGHLLATGITAAHHDAFVERLAAEGFAPASQPHLTRDGWPCAWFRRR